ncbi:MAG: HAD family hydrolase [Thermoplasmata archaeon]
MPAVLLVIEEVLVPGLQLERWQWAWRPQGPVIPERRYRAAVRRALHRWDRRRWEALTGGPPLGAADGHRHLLRETLDGLAGHPLPEPEREVIVDRFLRCPLPRPAAPEVPTALSEWRGLGFRLGAVGRVPGPSGPEALARAGLADAFDHVAGTAPDSPALPEKEAYRAAVRGLGVPPRETTFVGTLLWSEVRAARRAGLAAVLLDRTDLAPRVEELRLPRLTELRPKAAPGEDRPTATDGP